MIGGQTVALVMIVRDEEARIGACLAAARPHIDSWTIVDTGSVDRTPDIVLEALEGIPGRLWRRPWQGFARTRSLSYRKARGSADWLLLMDADMQVEVDPGWSPDPDVDAWMVEMGDDRYSWRLPLLVRGDLPWESRGTPVTGRHAVTVLPDGTTGRIAPTDAVRIRRSDSWSVDKAQRLVADLEADYEASPDDPRVVFYLAQAYADVGHPGALAMFQRRALMGGYPEEAFVAAYRGATLLTDPSQQLHAMLAAWEMRPSRLEPLHAAVRGLNRMGMHRVAHLISQVPVIPTDDMLFVNRYVWSWGMAFERAVAALSIGERAEGEALASQAMPLLPDRERAFLSALLEATA